MKKPLIQPLSNFIVVKPVAVEEVTEGGLYKPVSALSQKPDRGTIVASGPGTHLQKTTVKPGQTVLYNKGAGIEIDVEGDACLIMREDTILAIL